MRKRLATLSLPTIGLFLGLGGGLVAKPAQAGFLDELARAMFGRPPAQVVPDAFIPLEMTVRPRTRRATAKASAPKPAPPAVKLDPATDPQWYLKDPTLRRGDIVVAKSGVLVFEGGRENRHEAADFVSLERSRFVPKALKPRIVAAATGRVPATPGPRAVAVSAARN